MNTGQSILNNFQNTKRNYLKKSKKNKSTEKKEKMKC